MEQEEQAKKVERFSLKSKRVLASLIIGIAVVFLFLAMLFIYLKSEAESQEQEIQPLVYPVFLDLPIPDVDEIEQVLNNPLFQKLEYKEKYFKVDLPEGKGRPNPFAPF